MNEITKQTIEQAVDSMFPHGEGRTTRPRVQSELERVAAVAFREGRNEALMGLMTADDVAEHFGISGRRARALIANRHERLGVGMRFGASWLVHRDELENIAPDEKYRAD